MDAFESLVAQLLRRQGYWTMTSVKVELTSADKRAIGRPSSPRWEIDVLAYKSEPRELLAIECKSLLDSRGVLYCGGQFEPNHRYKLFCDSRLRRVVLARLAKQLAKKGLCPRGSRPVLGLATGKIASGSDRDALRACFEAEGWWLWDDNRIHDQLRQAASEGYENEIATVVSKILLKPRRKFAGSRAE